jgi:hypothetical protein
MYALINQYNPNASQREVAGYVYSVHQNKDKAFSAAARALALQRVTGSKQALCVAQMLNGRFRGDYVLPTDIQRIEVFNLENSN